MCTVSRSGFLNTSFISGGIIHCYLLSEYEAFEIPKRHNIFRLCRRAANSAIIRITLSSNFKGVGWCWNCVGASMIGALYRCKKPTSSRLIKILWVNEPCPKDQKLTT